MVFKKPNKEAVFNLWRKNLTNFKRGPGFSALISNYFLSGCARANGTPPHPDHRSLYQQNTLRRKGQFSLIYSSTAFSFLLRLKMYTGAGDTFRFNHHQISTTLTIYLLKVFELTAVLSSVCLCSADVMTQLYAASAPFEVPGTVRIVV